MARTHIVKGHPGHKYRRQTLVMKCIVNSRIWLNVLYSFVVICPITNWRTYLRGFLIIVLG